MRDLRSRETRQLRAIEQVENFEPDLSLLAAAETNVLLNCHVGVDDPRCPCVGYGARRVAPRASRRRRQGG